MRFDVVTIFPEFFSGPLDYGVVRRARQAGLADVRLHDLRGYVHDRHRTVDDRPFGGGEGMVLKPEPLFDAVESLLAENGCEAQTQAIEEARPRVSPESARSNQKTAVVLLSASGKLFRQETARAFARLDRIILLCGRYEGVDERVAEHLATHELSIGDFVLSGGELAAALVIDAVTRLIPGALGNECSAVNESFSPSDATCGGPMQGAAAESRMARQVASQVLLDCPHYTRPSDFRGWTVPEVLLSGNHQEIRRWRAQQALEKTRRNRPDLLADGPLQSF